MSKPRYGEDTGVNQPLTTCGDFIEDDGDEMIIVGSVLTGAAPSDMQSNLNRKKISQSMDTRW